MALSTLVGIMAQVATYTGKKVEISQIMEAGNLFGPADCDFNTEPPIKPNAEGTYDIRIPGVTKML